jgi:hypothetical protein
MALGMLPALAPQLLALAAAAGGGLRLPPPFPQVSGETLSAVVSDTAPAQRQQLALVEGKDPNAVAWATLRSAIASTGFSRLEVRSSPDFDGELQAFAAGLVEGAVTQEMIYNHTTSTWPGFFGTAIGEPTPANISAFISAQDAYARTQSGDRSSAYSRSVGYAIAQLDGLIEGYLATAPASQPLTRTELLTHNLIGDLGEIVGALDQVPSATADGAAGAGTSEANHQRTRNLPRRRKISSCSALVKPTEDDVFISQVDWDDYNVMIKLIKDYVLPLIARDTGRHPRPFQLLSRAAVLL